MGVLVWSQGIDPCTPSKAFEAPAGQPYVVTPLARDLWREISFAALLVSMVISAGFSCPQGRSATRLIKIKNAGCCFCTKCVACLIEQSVEDEGRICASESSKQNKWD